MSRLHDHGKRVAPLPVDDLLSHFILTILHNSSTSFANGHQDYLDCRLFLERKVTNIDTETREALPARTRWTASLSSSADD